MEMEQNRFHFFVVFCECRQQHSFDKENIMAQLDNLY